MSRKGYARSVWVDEMPVGRIDCDAFLYMGSDPCWSPRREIQRPGDEDIHAGECLLCGGVGSIYIGPDGTIVLHRDIPEGSRRVCARCMRYGRERMTVPEVPDDPDVPVSTEPGYVSRGGITVPERYARLMKG